MNTTETNKKLVEFLGAKVTDIGGKQKPIYYPIIGESHTKLKFHNDWNWLMLVVDKVESLNCWFEMRTHTLGVRVIIDTYNNWNHEKQPIVNVDMKTKIEAVYNACSVFVDWYNGARKELK